MHARDEREARNPLLGRVLVLLGLGSGLTGGLGFWRDTEREGGRRGVMSLVRNGGRKGERGQATRGGTRRARAVRAGAPAGGREEAWEARENLSRDNRQATHSSWWEPGRPWASGASIESEARGGWPEGETRAQMEGAQGRKKEGETEGRGQRRADWVWGGGSRD